VASAKARIHLDSVSDFSGFLSELQLHGVTFISINENFDTSNPMVLATIHTANVRIVSAAITANASLMSLVHAVVIVTEITRKTTLLPPTHLKYK